MKKLAISKIVNFVRDTHPYAWNWPEETLHNWIGFFMLNGLIAVVSEDCRDIHGMVLFRTVMRAEDGADESKMNYDPEGNYIWIDYCYCASKRAMKGLGLCVLHRVGERGFIAWERCNQLSVWPVKHFKERLLGKECAISAN